MVRLTGLLSRLSPAHIAVIGDFNLDTYTVGKVRRISPEAPVAVLNVSSVEHRAGSAGNVVLNLLSLGATVTVIGRIGSDSTGDHLKTIFVTENISTTGLFVQLGYQTPVKNRVVAESQQIVRVDYEESTPLPEILEQTIIDSLPTLLAEVSVIAISDYDKGFLSRTLLSAIFEYAKNSKKTVIVDPKGIDFSKYQGATLIKPNLSELYAAANVHRGVPIEHAAAKVLEIVNAEALMVTRSEAGISLFYEDGKQEDYSVRIHEVKDVTGAGDTVLAMLAYGVASGLTLAEVTPLCNIAASVAIECFGCARVTIADLARRLLKLDRGNKIFDSEHIFALKHALKGSKAIALDLQGCKGFNYAIFQAIALLGGKQDTHLLVHLGNEDPACELLPILKELQSVDFVLVGNDGFDSLCQTLAIEEIHHLKV
ncbi:MAG: HldE protein [Parachlamydiaceae bacterium]|nr:HldE protein [Parachlamydiaceae bacterium]